MPLLGGLFYLILMIRSRFACDFNLFVFLRRADGCSTYTVRCPNSIAHRATVHLRSFDLDPISQGSMYVFRHL